MKSKLKYTLLPFSALYHTITKARNFLYNKNFLTSTSFQLPILVIGNLAIGGTGKTPHTEWVIQLLQKTKKTAVLSRGYGRKTKGFILANAQASAKTIGDEPLQIHQNFPDIPVAVCEDRVAGVKKLMELVHPEVIVLDDAFQHRKIKASLYILLTTYDNLIPNDFVLPMGKLREAAKNIERAHVVIVSKCPLDLSVKEKRKIIRELNPVNGQQVYFTGITYKDPILISGEAHNKTIKKALLITAIVNPTPLEVFLQNQGIEVTSLTYRDHYHYTKKDAISFAQKLKGLGEEAAIYTTQKDAVKLQPLLEKLDPTPLAFYVPIGLQVLFNQESELTNKILSHVNSF